MGSLFDPDSSVDILVVDLPREKCGQVGSEEKQMHRKRSVRVISVVLVGSFLLLSTLEAAGATFEILSSAIGWNPPTGSSHGSFRISILNRNRGVFSCFGTWFDNDKPAGSTITLSCSLDASPYSAAALAKDQFVERYQWTTGQLQLRGPGFVVHLNPDTGVGSACVQRPQYGMLCVDIPPGVRE